MAENEETGEKRIVGDKHPPIDTRFGKGNQASKGVRHGKGVSIITEVRRLLRQHVPTKDGSPSNTTYREAIAKGLLVHCIKGNPAAIREIMGRIDGPIPTELTGAGGGPIVTKHAGPDASAYTTEELEQLRAIYEAANARRGQ